MLRDHVHVHHNQQNTHTHLTIKSHACTLYIYVYNTGALYNVLGQLMGGPTQLAELQAVLERLQVRGGEGLVCSHKCTCYACMRM